MADSFLAQKLPDFTDPAHSEAVCRRPFTLRVEGQPWSVACGGAWFFAVRGSSSFADLATADPMPRYLRASPTEPVEVETHRLKAWAGVIPPGRRFEGQPSFGVLFGKVFDRRRLAALLDPIPFPKIILWDTTELVGVRSIGLESRGKWRAFLAALDGPPTPEMNTFSSRDSAGVSLMDELPAE